MTHDYSSAVSRWLKRNAFERSILKAALIDMDGTLYDSMPLHSQAWKRLAQEVGWQFSPEEFFMLEGATGAYTIDLLTLRSFGRHATADEIAELYERKTRYFRELPSPVPMPGADRMLDHLCSLGVCCVLVTGSGQNSLISRLDDDFPGVFRHDMKVTSRSVNRGKPFPDPFVRGMELAGVSPCQAIVVENAPLGVEAGVASQALTLAANTGPLPMSALAKADLAFASMPALAEALPAVTSLLRP